VHSLFEARWVKEIGPIKEEVSGAETKKEVSGAETKKEVSEADAKTESVGKLDTAVAIATTPADVQLKKTFGEIIAGQLDKHRNAITNSEATYKGELGQAVGNFARLSLKFNVITKHLEEHLEEFGRELQSCVDFLTHAQARAPKSAGS
jgi:hypothetical protein